MNQANEINEPIEIEKIIENTVVVTIDKLNSVALVDKMRNLKNATFKNTEQLLYNYKALKEHVEDESGYFAMMNKGKSASIVRFSKAKVTCNEDEALYSRAKSLERSKNDLERIEKELAKIKNKKGFDVIQIRYFEKKGNGETYSFEEIAEILSKREEYKETLSEKTVRRWRSALVQEISVGLFGSDAI